IGNPSLNHRYRKGFYSLFKTLQQNPFQYTVQGNSHNRLKSTNLIERLNQEVRRREKIIRIFPNQTSANRLIGAVLMDLHDEWIYSSRKYINFDK
ncbi:transposase, partial [Streptococcus suis]